MCQLAQHWQRRSQPNRSLQCRPLLLARDFQKGKVGPRSALVEEMRASLLGKSAYRISVAFEPTRWTCATSRLLSANSRGDRDGGPPFPRDGHGVHPDRRGPNARPLRISNGPVWASRRQCSLPTDCARLPSPRKLQHPRSAHAPGSAF